MDTLKYRVIAGGDRIKITPLAVLCLTLALCLLVVGISELDTTIRYVEMSLCDLRRQVALLRLAAKDSLSGVKVETRATDVSSPKETDYRPGSMSTRL